ncbi:MAG TPA: crosslink repair DNA glycosylase YcaQ family protein [Vicinamibacterales bacterium]|nr:crosslink repair DNA glycosylase YcaQ family protein [Vicinamibacterales bacterium]
MTLDDLRRAAVARTLFAPTTLQRALDRLGFVQADPIRAPARAQDLTLRHRVVDYRAGDLERQYVDLDVHEDVFVNYGFVTGAVQALMHPRGGPAPWKAGHGRRVRVLLDFVRTRGTVHPRDVDRHFSHGTVTNYWGGSSNATTHLLDAMHYRGLLRVARRDAGIRIYATYEHEPVRNDAATRRTHLDALVDVIVGMYAPLPALSLSMLVRRLRYAVPQWTDALTQTLHRAKRRLAHHRVDGADWYSPADGAAVDGPDDRVRLLAPFDPVVWDRRRFEMLWGWAYRFEAYTPVPKRKLGYYALPLLWHDRVIGWGNVSVKRTALKADLGYVDGRPPRDRTFRRGLDEELDRLRCFLAVARRGKASAENAERAETINRISHE